MESSRSEAPIYRPVRDRRYEISDTEIRGLARGFLHALMIEFRGEEVLRILTEINHSLTVPKGKTQ